MSSGLYKVTGQPGPVASSWGLSFQKASCGAGPGPVLGAGDLGVSETALPSRSQEESCPMVPKESVGSGRPCELLLSCPLRAKELCGLKRWPRASECRFLWVLREAVFRGE